MNLGRRRMIFNRYARPSFAGADLYVYSSDPVVQLDAIFPNDAEQFVRTPRQLDRLRATGLAADADGIFGPSLEWPYREFAVRLLSEPSDDIDPLATPIGDAPPQPVTRTRRSWQLERVREIVRPPSAETMRLCLFNVLVAVEWTPDQYTLRQLEWAFRAASDFLYDVTDGRLAFGQVIFGGLELMPCADIQILASNRILPRSWVDGLLRGEKYLPVRAGRGVWHSRNRISIDWAEPEGYRTLIHEWAHYALGLKDEYLRVATTPDGQPIVVPDHGQGSTSIMATLEGTSELVPHLNGNSLNRKSAEWQAITDRYPFVRPSERPLSGPGRLPLPLPRFECVGSLAQSYDAHRAQGELHLRRGPFLAIPHASTPELPRVPQINDRCWVYLLRGAGEGQPYPTRLIALGTLDARTTNDGFLLLGAETGDTVVLIGYDANGQLAAARSLITVLPDPQNRQMNCAVANAWHDATPPAAPLMAVAPRPPASGADPDQICVRVHVAADGAAPDRVLLFPLAQSTPAPTVVTGAEQEITVTTLDGHVLAIWGERLLISTFSQGGGPPSHVPASANPTTAGSSDGNIMLFFRPEQQQQDHSGLKVLTTLLHGAAEGQSGYVFALAGNQPLPPEIAPTLIVYTSAASAATDEAVLERLEGGAWQIVAGAAPVAGQQYVAAPLNATNAPRLVNPTDGVPSIEYYRLRRE